MNEYKMVPSTPSVAHKGWGFKQAQTFDALLCCGVFEDPPLYKITEGMQ